MIVIYITVVATGLIYILAPLLINENNAKTWLSSYNTMSKEEQKKFDLQGYLKFFRSFFYNLGVYGTIIYFVFYFLTDEQFAIIVWIAFQLLPLPFLIYKGNHFKNKKLRACQCFDIRGIVIKVVS